jgi:hypothetical protein
MYTLQGKTRPTQYVCFPCQSTCTRRTLHVSGPRTWQPFAKFSTTMDRATAPEKKGLPTQSSVCRLTDPWVHSHFLSQASYWSSGGNATLCRQPATRFTELISLACDRYVQYLFMGGNTSVLNQHKRGLQSWRCWLSTYHSPAFLTSCLHFPLSSPPGLQFNQVPSTKPKCWVWRTYGRHMVFQPLGHLP